MTEQNAADAWRTAALSLLSDPENEKMPLVSRPAKVSAASEMFFTELNKTCGVLFGYTEVATYADNAAHVVRCILTHGAEIPRGGFNAFEPIEGAPEFFRAKLKYLSRSLLEMIVCRIVDNFTSYLSDIIRECLGSRPELLRSKETMTLEEILAYPSTDELHRALVDRKVDGLAYLGFERLAKWIEQQLGSTALQNAKSRATLIEVLEARNCIVHNRSRTSPKFLRAIGKPEAQSLVNTPIRVTTEMLALAARATAECVAALDLELAAKFDLALK